jgi:hypothetical protein
VLACQGATAGQHPGEQAGVGAGIGNVQATAEYDHSAPTGVERSGVDGRVDADRSLPCCEVLLDRVLPHAHHHRATPLGRLLL